MNTQATQITDPHSSETVVAWPHQGRQITLTEDEVLEKVTSTLAMELNLSADQISNGTPIGESMDVSYFRLAGPIMTIENFFRTHLQDEMAREDLSVNIIVDKLMGRTNRISNCGSDADCVCAA